MSSTFSGDETAPFFGFLGAAAALVFSCKFSDRILCFTAFALILCISGKEEYSARVSDKDFPFL